MALKGEMKTSRVTQICMGVRVYTKTNARVEILASFKIDGFLQEWTREWVCCRRKSIWAESGGGAEGMPPESGWVSGRKKHVEARVSLCSATRQAQRPHRVPGTFSDLISLRPCDIYTLSARPKSNLH